MLQARDIPNIITIMRLILVPPVGWAILVGEYRLAFWLFFLAGFSDALDGFLARAFHWQSRLGATLDPIADKSLMILAFFCLFWVGLIPWWLFAAVLLRDLVIIGGALAYQYLTHALHMEPLLLGKLNTALQILVVLAILLHLAFGWFAPEWINYMSLLLLATTAISGVAYVIEWGRRARRYRAS
ncbi:MAG: CDP-alcohol phosphatidyltransferase family protein [Thiotrichales bacterium]